MTTAAPKRIIIPGLSSEEQNSKMLAMKLLQTSEQEKWTNREILGACAVFAACTIKARYNILEREQTFNAFVQMARNILNQM